MWPGYGSTGSTSPRYRGAPRASSSVDRPEAVAQVVALDDPASTGRRASGGRPAATSPGRSRAADLRPSRPRSRRRARVRSGSRGCRASTTAAPRPSRRRRRTRRPCRRRRCPWPRGAPRTRRVGEGMAAGALVGREVGVEVEVDRARDVAGVVGGATGAGLAEVPAARRRCAAVGRRAARRGLRGRSSGGGHRARVAPRAVCYASPPRLRPPRPPPATGPRGPSLRRSSVVERAAVNRLVVGSSPTAGATFLIRKPYFVWVFTTRDDPATADCA